MRRRSAAALSRTCNTFIMRDARPGSTQYQPAPPRYRIGRRARFPRSTSRMILPARSTVCRRRCRRFGRSRPENRSSPALAVCAAITPSRNAAVGRAQGTQREAVLHRRIGKSPIAPGQEARVIGFEVGATEHPGRDGSCCAAAGSAVPQRGLCLPQPVEMPRRSRHDARWRTATAAARMRAPAARCARW